MIGLKFKEQRVIMSLKTGPGILIPAIDTSKKFMCWRTNIEKKLDQIS